MIKNVIFDLGGVLFDFHPQKYFEVMGLDHIEATRYQNIIWNSMEWHLLDIGKISYTDAINAICEKNPFYANTLRYLLENRSNEHVLTQKEDMLLYLKKLVALEFKIYFLSNVIATDLEYNSKNFEVFNLITGGTYSCLCGYAKPSDEIYQELLRTYNLNPSECVFVDDLDINCKGAINNGIKSILFKDSLQAQKDLDEVLNIDDDYPLILKRPNK